MPSHIGAHLPIHDEFGRRSVLLLGGLGMTGLLGARLSTDLAHAAGRTAPAGTDVGLPSPPSPPAPGTPAQEPWSSGGIGTWQTSQRQSSTPDEDRTATDHGGVHLIGDSIGTRLLPALQAVIDRPLSYDVWNGRPTRPALDHLRRAAAEKRLAPTVVVVLGSNDIFDPWHFEDDVQRCIDVAGDRRVLWVAPYVSRPASPTADLRNSALLGLALERRAAAGDLEVVRWFELLARSGRRLGSLIDDGVHPSTGGAKALADLVVAALG